MDRQYEYYHIFNDGDHPDIYVMAALKDLQLTLFKIVPWIIFDLSKMASKTFPLNDTPMLVKMS